MIVTIHGTGIELTPAIREYAETKIESLTKFFDQITKAEIDVGMTTQHHNKGEIYYADVNLHIPGNVLRVSKEEKDLYKAIDTVKDHLKIDLEKIKGKKRAKDKKGLRQEKEYRA